MTDTLLPSHLILVHGNRPETLRDLLVTWMKRHPLAPLEHDVVLVQSNGIAQWLRLALAADPEAGGCGIATALDFSLPSRFLWRVYRAVLGEAAVPATSPFDKSRLVWRLMRLLPELVDRPAYAPLRRFLRNDTDLRKRFQLAERLADLLDQYQVYRADWLKAWEAGQDVLIDARGRSRAMAEVDAWQPELWRALLADVGASPAGSAPGVRPGRAAVHEAFLETAARWPDGRPPAGLPRRIMVFGISSLPRQSLEVLARLGRWIQVFMCVPNPCRYYWADIIPDRELPRAGPGRHPCRAGWPGAIREEDLHQHAHPLLAAWGRQGRDFIGLLDEFDGAEARAAYQRHFTEMGQRIELFEPGDASTLLGQLQDDILELRPPGEARDIHGGVDPDRDRSIRFHACHGPQREVEVLQDHLLAAFNADPTLQPRDIIVMVPDIETHAPHIQAVFGRLERDDPRHLPFSVADQVQRRVDPLLRALEQLLALPQSRIGVSEVLDWLEVAAIRQRFRIGEADLPTLRRWILGANIRWGLHDAHRASLDLPAGAPAAQAAQNTWLFGLRRMLAGYALGETPLAWEDIAPYDEIGGLDAALLGPLVQCLDSLESSWRRLREPATVDGWCGRFRILLADLFQAEAREDALTLRRLELALQQWEEAGREAGLTETLPLTVAGPYWLSLLDDRGLSQRFFAGAVTFATLMPMRAIPFRRVYLLGMNDGDYPRARPPLDFDLMGRDYRPGDRSRREDDRYLFLEALLSAREHLHVSWVGRGITDNAPRPPSVLVGQLRDHIAAVWRLPGSEQGGGQSLVQRLTTWHPLQPFSPACFPDHPRPDGPFTYAHEWQPRSGGEPAAPEEPLQPLEREEPLTLEELGRFLKEPVKAFYRGRLQVHFEEEDSATEDVEPFVLDALGNWRLQDELIQLQREVVDRGGDPATVEALRHAALQCGLSRIARRGELAAGGVGAVMRETLAEPMADLFAHYRKCLDGWPIVIDAEDDLAHGHRFDDQGPVIVDRLGGIRQSADGRRARIVLESSHLVDSKDRYRPEVVLRHWVRHLGHHVAGGPLTTEILSKKGHVTLEPMDIGVAAQRLDDILAAWREGMTRPLPLAIATAFAWLRTTDMDKARQVYEGTRNNQGEVARDPYLRRAYPDHACLVADGHFNQWATRLLEPVLLAMATARGAEMAVAPGEPIA